MERLPAFRFLDWKNVDNEKATHAGLQALMAWGLQEGAQLLSLLGEKEQAANFLALSEKMKRHTPDCDGSKQAAALLSLAGLSDPDTLNREIIARAAPKATPPSWAIICSRRRQRQGI